jgi:hypothetical protein
MVVRASECHYDRVKSGKISSIIDDALGTVARLFVAVSAHSTAAT